ncbi:MAG: DNA polymerase III subunit alpha [Deltaproteobacteria bacterium]|nr:MAG: DNA polymerase III subunit alpha [Deltaproteobacteria bacterium]
MGYAELTARSAFSLLEGASLPEEMAEACATQGVDHLAVVDRDAVYGLVRAHRVARELGVHLISGATVTLVAHPSVVLLVENRRGWGNLCRLLTEARSTVEKGRAQLDLPRVLEHSDGLSAILRHGWLPDAAHRLKQAFGDRLAVGWSRRLLPSDRARERSARELAAALDLPIVASNEPLFHHPDRKRLADVLTCIRRRTTLRGAGRWLHASDARHLLPEAVFRERYAAVPEAIANAQRLAERCTFSLDELQYGYPREVVPEGYTPMSWLTHLVEEGLAWRYPDGPPAKVRGAVCHELGVIEQLDFPAYFLTVYDIVRFARSRGILCQGRGSAANSAVCFALGITSVDPALHELLFERFISAERGEPPDIDVDFEHERREEVIQYIYERYGRDRAALVNEVISYRRRSAIRDVGKVFGLSLDQVDRLAKGTDRWSAGNLAQIDDLVQESGLDPRDVGVRQTLQLADELAGFPRHLSQHVGGFTITETPLIELVPVEAASMEARTVIQWDKDDIDVLRFVKVDVLGLGMLTAIRKCFELVSETYGLRYDLASVPKEDPAVYDMFCRADTVGVFQIESRAQMSMLPRLRPRCFYDLVIEVAIVRPGPIQGGMVHPFLRRRNGEEPVVYPHPDVEPILARTMGVPLFQEQVMAMAVAVGGFSPGEADALRRAMGAWRKTGDLGPIGRRLVDRMIARGIAPDYAEQIFEQIKGFGEYGFPESHSASFALLVYVSGWLKCHWPEAFAAALINSQPMGFYSPRSLVGDAQRHHVEVRPVCVARSAWDCTLECDGVALKTAAGPPHLEPRPERAAMRLGLRLVRGFGDADGEAVLQAREERPFRDLADFAGRTLLDRGKLQALADADAFACFGVSRREAAWILQGLWTDAPLFAGQYRVEPETRLPREDRLAAIRADYRAVGLSVDKHPIDVFRGALDARGVRLSAELQAVTHGTRVRVAGLVANRQRPGTANGVVFMTLEDETGMINLVVWPKVWDRYRRIARRAAVIGVDGTLQRDGDAVSVLVSAFWLLQADPVVSARSRDFR